MIPVVAGAAKIISSKIHISFKTPSEKRAAKVLPGVVAAAMGGNLLAVKVLDTRRFLGIQKERDVWASGYNQVAQARPDLISAYEAHKDSLGAIDQSGPEAAAASITASAGAGVVTASKGANAGGNFADTVGQFVQGIFQPTASSAAQQAGKEAGNTIKGPILILAAGVGLLVVVLLVKRR